MGECPQCHSPLEITEQNFGTLFTCPHCQAVFFVGWDGTPELPQATPPEPTYENSASTGFSAPIDVSFQEQPVTPPQENFETTSPTEPSVIEIPAPSETSVMEPPSWDHPLDFSAEAVAPPPAVEVDASANFKDVVDYGNSAHPVGPMSYTVTLKGLEISDIRNRVKEALSDTRFGWDAQEIMRSTKDGTLVLSDLSPAKAVVLINRVKYLPIVVSWKQNVLS